MGTFNNLNEYFNITVVNIIYIQHYIFNSDLILKFCID